MNSLDRKTRTGQPDPEKRIVCTEQDTTWNLTMTDRRASLRKSELWKPEQDRTGLPRQTGQSWMTRRGHERPARTDWPERDD